MNDSVCCLPLKSLSGSEKLRLVRSQKEISRANVQNDGLYP